MKRKIIECKSILIVMLFLISAVLVAAKARQSSDHTQATASEETKVSNTAVEQQMKARQTTESPAAVLEEAVPTAAVIKYKYPFNTMSQDWEPRQLDGFKEYEVPEDFTDGELPLIIQQYLWIICNQYNFDYATALAVIEIESGYRWDARGQAGEVGYMQVIEKYHKDRMSKLNVDDLENPFQNVTVAVDYLAELKERFGSTDKTLTAYHYGVTGAYKYVWNEDENNSCKYSIKVNKTRKRIARQIGGEE